MDELVRFVRIVAVGEDCVGNLCLGVDARVVALLHHLHTLNDKSASLVVLHHDRRGIGGSGVAYAICPGIGTGDNLRDGIGVRAGLGIGNVAKRCRLIGDVANRLRLGILGKLDRRHLALGALGHGDAVVGCKLHGKGIAIGPIATFEHLLGAQTVFGLKCYAVGAVVVGELKRVFSGNLSARKRDNLALDGVASSRLLLATDLTFHEAKAGRKHRLVSRAGNSVNDARQHVTVGRLALGGELAHAILVALLKVIYANGLAGLDGMGAAVLERKGVAHGLAIRIEYACLIALLGLRRATVGILHGRCRGKEMIELKRAQIGAIGGIIVLIKSHAVDARIGKDRRQLTVALATVLDIAQDGLGALRRLVIAHMHQVVRKRRRHTLGSTCLAPCQVFLGI